MGTDTPTDDLYATQEAPFPQALQLLVKNLRYRPGWKFHLGQLDRGQGSRGLTLVITTLGYDSYHVDQGETYRVNHYMPVPPAAFNLSSWRMWLFEQLLLVERHEAMEFFQVAGERPYAPNHKPGWSPYIVTELTSVEDRETDFRGVRHVRAPEDQ